MTKPFNQKLSSGEAVLGLCNMYPDAGVIEGMAPGWDFVWIDQQHGQLGYDAVANAVRTCDALNLASVVRVPGHEWSLIGPIADLVPEAIMVPMVDNVEQVQRIVRATRFAPLGARSYGGRRAIDRFGREFYRERELLVLAQVETLESVANAEAIAATEGIDCLFFGPDDMKVQMGLPINTAPLESKPLREALEKTAAAARNAGKMCGTVAATPAVAKFCAELGYQILVGGGDSMFLRTGATKALADIQQGLAARAPVAADPNAPRSVY